MSEGAPLAGPAARWKCSRVLASAARAARRGRARAVVAALLSCSVLGACAQIPTSGPVVPGQPVDVPVRYLAPVVDSPQPGATPEQVVRGFLHAEVDYTGEHAVARKYIVPGPMQTSWSADAGVVVYGPGGLQLTGPSVPAVATTAAVSPVRKAPTRTHGVAHGRPTVVRRSPCCVPASRPTRAPSSAPATVSPTPPGPTTIPPDGTRTLVHVVVSVLASVDPQGVYAVAAMGSTRSFDFGLVVTGGQWRIARLDDGVLISQRDFEDTFQALAVYFPDLSGEWMIPDVRWFVRATGPGDTPVVGLVTALLDGPSPWLRPAVVNAFPPATKLAVTDSVPVDPDGVASVDLSARALAASPAERVVMRAQLNDTLGLSSGTDTDVVPGLTQVVIKVSGTPLDISDAQPAAVPGRPLDPASRLALASSVAFDTDPVVIDAKGRLARLQGGGAIVPVSGAAAIGGPGLASPGISTDATMMAVLSSGGTKLLLAANGGRPSTVVEGRQLTAPSLDPQGWVWTASAPAVPGGPDGNFSISAARFGVTAPVLVSAPALRGVDVTTLRISRDGSRALVLGHRGAAMVLLVLAVVRGSACAGRVGSEQLQPDQPCALGDIALAMMPDLVEASDAGWVDDRTVVVLGQNGARGPVEPWLVELGGPVLPTAPLSGLVRGASTVTAAGADQLYLGDRAGRVWRLEVGWEQIAAAGTARWPTMPG